MTTNEAQANSNTMTSTMFVFSTPIQVFFDSGSSKSFVSTAFALHADWELALLKNKLVVTTPLGEQILRTSVFKGCEILVEGVVLKANLILLEIYDFNVILSMDCLSTYRALVDCFTKKIVFQKLGFPDLEFESDRRILPTCVILTLPGTCGW